MSSNDQSININNMLKLNKGDNLIEIGNKQRDITSIEIGNKQREITQLK